MTEPTVITNRMLACFSAVFPTLSDIEIMRADQAALPEWDSLASISLVTIIEEEFELEIDDDNIAKMTSFRAADAALTELLGI